MLDKDNTTKLSKNLWWDKRTKLEKILLSSIILIIISALIFATSIFRKITNENTSNICQKKGCIVSAARILKNMNAKVDPCEDFYEFACGKYTENSHIPEDEVSVTSFDEISDKIVENYRTIMEKPISKDEILPIQQTKTLYKMCMNYSSTEQEDFIKFKKMLKDLGGWPVLEGNNWNEQQFDWKTTQYNFRKVGLYSNQFISTYIGLDAKNSTQRIFTIDQPCGGFAKILKKGFNETIVKAYYDYLVDIAILYGADKLQASKDLRQYMEFRIELAKIIKPSEERRNASLEYNPMTIRDLQLNYPGFPWLQYINNKLEPFVALTFDDIVVVAIPEYLEKLEKLLSVTPKRAIANYLFVSLIEGFQFSEEMRRKRLDFDKIFLGVTTDPPKWKTCISSGLYLARSAMYVRHYMKTRTKNLVKEMVEDVRSTFMENLKKYTWMDAKTKKRAMQKAEMMKSFVGFSEQLYDDQEIIKEYDGVVIHEESPLKTSLGMSIWSRNKYLKKYYEPYDKNDWKHKAFPTVVNAFYDHTENGIQIPAGILNEPFFENDRPQYMNYGAIGYIIGHEIIHGFDDLGRQYDMEGNLADWWEPAANKSFQEKAQCIVDQYSNHTHKNINKTLNGINTQSENIADNGGVKMAYIAYQKWLERNKPEPHLPGLKYTPQQMFWLSAANIWCSKVRPEVEKLQVMNDLHSPNYYRIIIPFMNSGYFAKDFNCPLGSKMNPERKCSLY